MTPHKPIPVAGHIECKVCGAIMQHGQYWLNPKDRGQEVGSDCDKARAFIYPDPVKVAKAEARAKETDAERAKRYQEAICKYVNAQGPHMSPNWKDHLAEEADLEPDMGNPYQPLRPKKRE